MNNTSTRVRVPSSYEARLRAAITQSTPSERAELLEFRTRMYGPRSAFADAARVRWMYDEAPSASAKGPSLWTFRAEDAIHGQIGAIRTSVRAGDRETDFAWLVDLMLSPPYRARGVGAVLPRVAQDFVGATGATESSEAAQKAFRRDGWTLLGTFPRWALAVSAEAFRVRAGGRLATLAPAVAAASSALGLLAKGRAFGRTLVPLTAFDERADLVWTRVAPRWPVIARRDLAWLSWRWDACPDARGAQRFSLERRGEPLGWVVLRVDEDRGLRTGDVVDLLCAPEDLDALLALSVAELRARDVDVVHCGLLAPGAPSALTANGFVRRDTGHTIMAYAAPELTDAAKWFITTGDSDLDRRREGTTYA